VMTDVDVYSNTQEIIHKNNMRDVINNRSSSYPLI